MSQSSLLLEHLDENLISVAAQISSRKKLLQEVARLLTLPLEAEVREKDIYHHLLEREKLGNTGIGNGVALPHSRCSATNKTVIAVITLDTPIDYHSIDRQPVDVAFGLLVPLDASKEHLDMLSEIACMMTNNDYKSQLSNASNANQLIELIRTWST